jgi:K+-sensing histidine kinase KdpD
LESKQESSQLILKLRRLYRSRRILPWKHLLQRALQYTTEALDADAGYLRTVAHRDATSIETCTDGSRIARFRTLLDEQEMNAAPTADLIPLQTKESDYWLLSVPLHSPYPLARMVFLGAIEPLTDEETLQEAAGILVSLFHEAQIGQTHNSDAEKKKRLDHYRRLNTTLQEINRFKTVTAAVKQLYQATLTLIDSDCGAMFYEEIPPNDATTVTIGRKECLELLEYFHRADSRSNFLLEDAVIHIVEAQDVPELVDAAKQAEIHTLLALPLRPHDQAKGILLLCREDKAAFSEQERALATILTSQTSLTIHNAHLFKQEQDQRQLAESMTQAAKALTRSLDLNEILDEILAQLDRVVPHDASNVMFIKDDEARVVRKRGYQRFAPNAENLEELSLPLDLPDLHVMIETRCAALIPDTTTSELWTNLETDSSAWIRSFIGAPIIIGDEVIGFVNVHSATPGYFNETHVHRLETFTDYVALAVQNARLFHESQQRQRYLQDLNVVTATVNSTMQLAPILQKGLQQALKVAGLQHGGIYLWNENARTLNLYVREELPEDGIDTLQVLQSSDSIVGKAFVDGKPVQNVSHGPASPLDATTFFQIAIPLIVEDRTVGVMALGSDQDITMITTHLQHLQAISDQLALAVRREQLSQQLREQLQALQYLYEASTGLMTQMDMQDALFVLLRTLCDVLPNALGAAFYLRTGDEWQRIKTYTRTKTHTFAALWKEGKIEEEEVAFLNSCCRERVPVIISERRGHEMTFWSQAQQAGAQRLIYKPLILPTGELLGVAGIISAEKEHLSPQNSALTQALLQEGAAAISRIRLYEQTRREESQMRAMLEASQDGIFLVGNDQSVRYVNKRALKLLNMPKSRSYWEDRPFSDIIAFVEKDNDEMARWLTEHTLTSGLTDSPSTSENNDVIFETGQGLQLTPHYRHVYSAQDKLLGTLILIRDVTERQTLERMRGDLLHMLVHDMRNPLSVIINALHMLRDPDTQEIAQEINQLALSNAEQILTLVNAILDINKLESGQFDIRQEPHPLGPLLDYLDRQALLANNDITIERDFPEDLPLAFIDPEVVRRVFQNLTDNAFKFVPAKQGRIQVTATQYDAHIKIEVFNNGPSISPEIKERLFEKFIAGNYSGQGYGLGLAFCRLAVEAHGGEIWAENHPEDGVSFYFTLPVAD